ESVIILFKQGKPLADAQGNIVVLTGNPDEATIKNFITTSFGGAIEQASAYHDQQQAQQQQEAPFVEGPQEEEIPAELPQEEVTTEMPEQVPPTTTTEVPGQGIPPTTTEVIQQQPQTLIIEDRPWEVQEMTGDYPWWIDYGYNPSPAWWAWNPLW